MVLFQGVGAGLMGVMNFSGELSAGMKKEHQLPLNSSPSGTFVHVLFYNASMFLQYCFMKSKRIVEAVLKK